MQEGEKMSYLLHGLPANQALKMEEILQHGMKGSFSGAPKGSQGFTALTRRQPSQIFTNTSPLQFFGLKFPQIYRKDFSFGFLGWKSDNGKAGLATGQVNIFCCLKYKPALSSSPLMCLGKLNALLATRNWFCRRALERQKLL